MTKEEFLKKLENNLKSLTEEAKKEELNKYQNLNNYNLDPNKVANEIYQKRGIKIEISNNIKFIDAATIIINNLQSKDKNKIKDVLIFLLYIIFLIIIIKLPFLLVRDMSYNIFSFLFMNNTIYILFNLAFELLYAAVSIITFIKMFKKKALEIENKPNQKEK